MQSESPPRASSSSTADLVYAEQVGLLYASISSAVPAIIAVSGIVSFLLWDAVPRAWLLSWIGVMLTLGAARLGLRALFSRKGVNRSDRHWGRLYILMAGLTGVGWGAAAFVFLPIIEPAQQLTLTLITMAYMAGAVTTQFPLPGAFVAIMYTGLLPLTYRLFEMGGTVNLSLGVLMVVFLAFVQGASGRLRRMLVASLQLGFENRALADRLQQEKQEAERLNMALEVEVNVRRRAEQELIEARTDAENANRAKSDFLANVSHEIRTPMNAIIGMSHLALQMELGTEQRSYIEKVHRASDALQGVISNILDYSRLADGRLEVRSSVFRLRGVFEHLAAILEPQAEQKGLQLDFDLPHDLPMVEGDSARLGQVLLNIGNNAVKFTEQGGVTVSARLEGGDGDAVLHCSIADTGIGIDEQQRQQLFDSFGQVDATTTRRFGGAGLGLSIASHLLELMGGTISVDSRPGEGSVFEVSLPLSISGADDRGGRAGPSSESQSGAVEQPAGGEVLEVLDGAHLDQLLEELRAKVRDFDTDAQALVETLLRGSDDADLGAQLRQVSIKLQQYDFEGARELLEQAARGNDASAWGVRPGSRDHACGND